jgi:hypothetical protein
MSRDSHGHVTLTVTLPLLALTVSRPPRFNRRVTLFNGLHG